MIAALYVQKDGAYYGLPDVDPWDEERDARTYAGPHPVVAHPPCNRWSVLAALHQKHGYIIGDDGGCFEAALDAVRTFGGVLEHPAHSFAWAAFQLPAPISHGWQTTFDDPGWSTEVSQVAYGHPARKRTWLYFVGDNPPPALKWNEPRALTVVSDAGSTINRKRWGDFAGSVQGAEASRTPLAFRDELVGLAESSRANVAGLQPKMTGTPSSDE